MTEKILIERAVVEQAIEALNSDRVHLGIRAKVSLRAALATAEQPQGPVATQETKRLDWLIENAGAQCERTSEGGYYVRAWVCMSEPGNDGGPGGYFIARGKSHRECIDIFLSGYALRVV